MASLRPYALKFALSAIALTVACVPAFAQKPIQGKQVPALVTSGKAAVLGAYSQGETLSFTVNLALRNEDELDTLIADLYNPASKKFHKYLLPNEFDTRFGPTQSDYEAVLSWAEASGFTVVRKVGNNRLIELKAPVAAINRAFHVSITAYHDSVLNRNFYAPDREPSVDLDVPLASVEGLETSEPITNHLKAGPNATRTTAAGVQKVTSTAVTAGGTNHMIYAGDTPGSSILELDPVSVAKAAKPRIVGSAPDGEYLPSDMRAAYYGHGPLTGAGQSVGIFSFDGYLTSDLAVYYSNSGFSSSIPVTNRIVGTYSGGCFSSTNGTSGTCDDGEQILDIVNVQGMAPGLSNIYFYEYTSASSELSLMATDNLAKVLSSSWGGGGFGTASDTYFKQFATQGQTFLNATGDSGGFNSSTYSAPSLDANIIQVGGTSLVTNGAGGPWQSETAWTESGGGPWVTGIATSGKVTIPAFQSQAGVINSTNKGSAAYRNSPDMAAEADFDNPTADNGAYLGGYGGTSFATPRMAGYMALVNQFAVANGGSTIGFFDANMYTGALSASYSHYMHDITSGSNPSTAGTTVYTYYAVTGYDDVTGWGSPNGEGLLYYLAAIPDFAVSPSAAAMTITRGATNNTGSETVTVSPYNGFSSAATVTLSATGLPTGVSYTATTGTTSTAPTITFAADAATAIQGTYTVTISGSATVGSNTVTRSTTFILTILKRVNGDFTVAAGAAAATGGGSGTSTITITEGAISGPIMLTATTPTGVTAAFDNPAYDNAGTITSTVSGSENLTLTVSPGVVAGTYPVTVTGISGGNIIHSATFNLTVTAPTSYVLNGGFETTTGSGTTLAATNWTTTSGVITSGASAAHTGSIYAYMDGYGAVHTDTVSQASIAIPAGKTTATLGFWVYIGTAETTTTAQNDVLTIAVTPSGGTATTLGTLSNLNHSAGYVFYSYDLTPYIGQTVSITFTGVENASLLTFFKVDDVSVFCSPN